MQFPQFDCQQPRIWNDKCLDYFRLFNIPESMWASEATMNFDGTTAKWLQVYKEQHGVTTWDELVQAVEEKFGADDYRSALIELLELKQQGSVENCAAAFESLQYQICMHNSGYDDEVLFVSHLVKGLKDEIQGPVQLQLPSTVTRSILLAKIQ